jgi:hypothetical protein
MTTWLQKHSKVLVWSFIVLIAIYFQQGFQFAVIATSFLLANYFNSVFLWNDLSTLYAESKSNFLLNLLIAVSTNVTFLFSLNAEYVYYFLVWVIPILGFIFFFLYRKYKK